jgi:hypothetical protein
MLGLVMGSNPLPTENAFLVQLAEDVDPVCGAFAGRVEHLESGVRARFRSREELFALFARMLSECGERSARNPNLEER